MPNIGISIDDFTVPYEDLVYEKDYLYISTISNPIEGNEEGLAKLIELFNEFQTVVEKYHELISTDLTTVSAAAEKMLNTDGSLTTYFETWC